MAASPAYGDTLHTSSVILEPVPQYSDFLDRAQLKVFYNNKLPYVTPVCVSYKQPTLHLSIMWQVYQKVFSAYGDTLHTSSVILEPVPQYSDFLDRAQLLTQKLPNQGYVAPRMKSSL
jgi:hypothetical protein